MSNTSELTLDWYWNDLARRLRDSAKWNEQQIASARTMFYAGAACFSDLLVVAKKLPLDVGETVISNLEEELLEADEELKRK